MPILDGNIIKAAVVLLHDGFDELVNVYHFRAEVTGTPTEASKLNGIANTFDDIYSALAPAMASVFTPSRIELFNETLNQPLPTLSFPLFSGGTDIAQAMPPGTSLYAFLRTGFTRAIGKKFFPPGTENFHLNGIWASGVTTAVATALTFLTSPQNDGNGLNMVFGVARGSSPIARFVLPFTSGVVSGVVHYQRRRRPGVGS